VLPLRRTAGRPEILLVTSNRGRRWVLPKGLIEAHLSPADSALAEAREEAGVEGSVLGEPVGSYEYSKWGGVCQVEVFLMHVERELDAWPEADSRQRQWVSLEQARQVLDERVPRRILDAVEGRLL
jgi:phosphohistidine phosphatase